MHKYEIKFNCEIPKYIEISKHIKKMIDENSVDDGEKLPSIRKLSKILMVNEVTIVSAYKKLEAEGYAYQKMGSGTYAKRRDTNIKFKKEYSNTLKKISGRAGAQGRLRPPRRATRRKTASSTRRPSRSRNAATPTKRS